MVGSAMTTLRSNIIRLASAHPELRPTLLPLLGTPKTASAKRKARRPRKASVSPLVTLTQGTTGIYVDADNLDDVARVLRLRGFRAGGERGGRILVPSGRSVDFDAVADALEDSGYVVEA